MKQKHFKHPSCSHLSTSIAPSTVPLHLFLNLACICVHCFTLLLWPSNLESTWQWDREGEREREAMTHWLTYTASGGEGGTIHTPDLVHCCPLQISLSRELRTGKNRMYVCLEENSLRSLWWRDFKVSPPLSVSVLKLFKQKAVCWPMHSKPGCIYRKDTPSVQIQTSFIPDCIQGTERDMI
jgi:hypothetical protein